MYRKLTQSLMGVVVAALATSTADALPVSETHTIIGSGLGSVGYTAFTVTSSGTFDVFTQGPTIDPQLYLFTDGDNNGILGNAVLDPLIATDDDDCSFAQCGPAGSFSNSLIDEITLGIGSYIAAVSDFSFSENEARAGTNFNDLTGDVDIVIAAGSTDTNSAEAVLRTSVPEPATTTILGMGLLATGLIMRRRIKRRVCSGGCEIRGANG